MRSFVRGNQPHTHSSSEYDKFAIVGADASFHGCFQYFQGALVIV